MRAPILLVLVPIGCGRQPELTATCEPAEDNALRVICSVEVDPPMDVEITLEEAGVSATGRDEIVLWRLLPETRYTWVARAGGAEVTGEVTTGRLPLPADLHVEREGADTPDDVLFLVDCGQPGARQPTAVALDAQGRVVWYQPLAADLPEGEHPIVGLTWSEDGTVLGVLDRSRVREFALDGTLLLDLPAGDGVDRVVHHDVFRRDGRTYVVTAHLQEDYIVDGVDAYDPDGTLLFRWDLSMVATPSGDGGIGIIYWGEQWAGAADWAHANGLYVADDGDFVLSMHSFSTVARFEGDPDDPAFGTPVWVLDGLGASPWPSTFAIDDPFANQHHPELLGDDVLQVFDNGAVGEPARALRVQLDEDAGAAEVIGSWPIPDVCPIEGAVYELSNDNLLVTCALRSTFYEIAPASGEIVGSTTARCAAAAADVALLPRAIPVDLHPRHE